MITTIEAQAVINGALSKANSISVAISVAILDAGGHLNAFLRMDDAVLGSIDVAIRKARTAVLFQVSSEMVWEYCKPGAPAPGLELSNNGLAPFAGGIPLRNSKGLLTGALGISGGSVEQDFEVAKAAAAAYSTE